MKKRFIMILILFSSFLFVNKVKAVNDISSSLENSFNFDNIVASKIATANDAKNKVGYLVTLAYPNSDGTYKIKKQQLYIYESKKILINLEKPINVKSKFGTINNYKQNHTILFDNNGDTSFNNWDTSFFDYNLNDFMKNYLYMYSNSDLSTNKNELCSSLFFIEPMYNNSEEIDTRFIDSLHDDHMSVMNCVNNIRYSNCSQKICLASGACNNDNFRKKCSSECTKYEKYINAINNTDQNLSYSYKQGVSLTSARNSYDSDVLKMFNLPTIKKEENYNGKVDADKLSSGWGFSQIVPFISIVGRINGKEAHNAKEYCYYNTAVCENGELLGTCIKENEYQTTSKVRHCQDSSYQKIDENTCYKDELNPVQSTCSNGGDVNNSCIIYATERYVCNDDEIEDMSMFGKTVSETTVCDTKIISKSKCPSGSTKSSSGESCVSKKKKHFTCSAGQKLSCTTGDIGSGGAKVKECHCVYYTSHASYTYKLMYPNSGVCNQNNYSDGGTCNNQMQIACSYCGPNDPCNGGHLICTRIKNKTTTTKHTTQASCKSGYSPTTKGVDNGEDYVRCIKPVEEKETEIPIYPSLVYDCPGNAGTDNPICSTGEISYYYNACPSGSTEVAGGYCRYTQNTVYDCNGLTELPNGQCQYHQDLRQTAYNCSSSKYCNPTCPNNPNISLNDCIKQAKSSGITINGTNYKASNYAQAFLLCRFDRCGENATCDEENEALQTKTKDIVSCILEKSDELKKDTSDAKIAQVKEECEKRLCPKKCFTPDSISGDNPSCSGKYDESQTVIYNEKETKEETNLTICNNQSPRVSKYGRFIAQNGNCKLYCRQKESKIDLPTNILTPMWRLSYFEWPTRNIGNHLKIETTNLCYIFTDKINGDASNCSFTESTIIDEIKKKDNATIKLQNNVTLSSTVKGEKISGNIVNNKNVNNPESFEIKTTAEYKIPANSNNILSVKKSNKTLTKNLGYGTIQISKDETLGQHDLKLTVSNYGFNNQFGVKVNGYTCHYNVSKNPSIITVCKITECKGNLIINNNYRNYNNKVKSKSYTNKENKVCKLEYTCGSKAGMENALESCVMSYYTDNDWVYDVALIDTTKLDSALKHCNSICNNDIEQVVFRKISISEPFPGISGKGRVSGTNWIGFEDIAENNDTTKPIYEIALTSSNIKNIRNYNKNNDYDDWKLNTNGLSSFIRNTSYVKTLTYKKSSSSTPIKKCAKIVTPPQPVIKWDDSFKKLRNDGTGYKRVQLIGNVKESTGKQLNLESGKYCITTGNKCEPNKTITPINNKITPPELSTNSSKQRICAIVKDKGGRESEVSCSDAYKVDTSPEYDIVFSTTSTKQNDWYKSLSVKVNVLDDDNDTVNINSGLYCITTNNSCEPNITATITKNTNINISSFSSNENPQNVCVRVVIKSGQRITKCSGKIYKFDNKKPSAPTISNPSNQACVAGPIVLTVGSKDEHSGIYNYQYTYSSNATTVGSNNETQWIMYENSAKSSFDTTPYVAQRNQYTYIRACDKAGNCSDKSQTYIRIGTAKKSDTLCYTSVQAAINDGNNGTVTMLRDSTENVSIASNKSLIIDMNGKTLNGSLTNNGSIWIQGNGKINTSGTAINNNGSLTVKNGTFGISTTGTNAGLINSGNCLIESGTFRAINTIQNRKTMTIKDGTFQASDTAIWQTESGTALWMYGGNITSANIFAIYNQSNHAIVAYNVNSIEKTNQGYIIRINKLSSNTYNVAVFGSSITSCPSWPTNSNNPHWYDALTYSDGQGTYKYCRIYSSDYSNPNNTWNTHLYNNGSKTAELNGWTWK